MTPGQARAMTPTPRARMPRRMKEVLSDLSMTLPFVWSGWRDEPIRFDGLNPVLITHHKS